MFDSASIAKSYLLAEKPLAWGFPQLLEEINGALAADDEVRILAAAVRLRQIAAARWTTSTPPVQSQQTDPRLHELARGALVSLLDRPDVVDTSTVGRAIAELAAHEVDNVRSAQPQDASASRMYAEAIAGKRSPSVSNSPGTPSDVPKWATQMNKLLFRGEVIRIVSPNATNLRLVLDRFEASDWKSAIDSPYAGTPDRHHDAIKGLNKRLTTIEFHSDSYGTRIAWRELPNELPLERPELPEQRP